MEANVVHDLVFVNNLGKKKYNTGGLVRLSAVQVQPASDGGLPNSRVISVKRP